MNGPGQHPLFDAIIAADLSAIERLVADGSDIEMRDSMGEPAIFAAISAVEFAEEGEDRERRLTLVRGMIDLGADLNALCEHGTNVLLGAILGGDNGLVDWLLRQGVDPNHGCAEPWETICDAVKRPGFSGGSYL